MPSWKSKDGWLFFGDSYASGQIAFFETPCIFPRHLEFSETSFQEFLRTSLELLVLRSLSAADPKIMAEGCLHRFNSHCLIERWHAIVEE